MLPGTKVRVEVLESGVGWKTCRSKSDVKHATVINEKNSDKTTINPALTGPASKFCHQWLIHPFLSGVRTESKMGVKK